jgi:hypothetical protein
MAAAQTISRESFVDAIALTLTLSQRERGEEIFVLNRISTVE